MKFSKTWRYSLSEILYFYIEHQLAIFNHMTRDDAIMEDREDCFDIATTFDFHRHND